MAEKRKDSKGRVLRTGESERADGRYQYRFTQHGKRYTLYANTLKELREKEDELQTALTLRMDYIKGKMTVGDLCDKYMQQKENIKPSTKHTYNHRLNAIRKDPISQLSIADVTTSDVKEWCIRQSRTYVYDTVRKRLATLRSAFDVALGDRAVYSNPCNFELKSVITYQKQKQISLNDTEIEVFLHEIQSNPYSARYYRLILILLHTGIRIGECLGLTVDDIDFENRMLNIDKQSVRFGTHHHITTPKTTSSCRNVPLDDTALQALKEEIAFHPPLNKVIDGHSGFIFHNDVDILRDTVIIVAIRNVIKRYNATRKNNDILLPPITPHTLRHTFCTHMIEREMSPIALQQIMGHSDARITLETYTHPSQEWAFSKFYDASEDT